MPPHDIFCLTFEPPRPPRARSGKCIPAEEAIVEKSDPRARKHLYRSQMEGIQHSSGYSNTIMIAGNEMYTLWIDESVCRRLVEFSSQLESLAVLKRLKFASSRGLSNLLAFFHGRF